MFNFQDIEKVIKTRNYYLDRIKYDKVGKMIHNKDPIYFMPNFVDDIKHFQLDGKYSYSKYSVVMMGILEDGRKVSVITENIYPYLEILVPEKYLKNPDTFRKEVEADITMKGPEGYDKFIKETHGIRSEKAEEMFKIQPKSSVVLYGKLGNQYMINKKPFVRIYFNKNYCRTNAIKYLKNKYDIFHDDTSCYYRVVCRDKKLSYASWLVIKNYTVDNDNTYIDGLVILVDINNIEVVEEEITDLAADKLISMAWDIETYNADEDGRIPLPDYDNHRIFMIGITFQFINDKKPFLKVCLSDCPVKESKDFITIVCDNEEQLITGMGRCIKCIRPDIIMGFNDTNYDWKWIIERGIKYKNVVRDFYKNISNLKYKTDIIDDELALKYYKDVRVKISSEKYIEGKNYQVDGYIPIDLQIIFRQMNPKSEQWSLNYFLTQNRISKKVDMPYYEMFNIYKTTYDFHHIKRIPVPEELLDKMNLVAEYCITDAQRCHELLLKRSIIQEKREISKLSYVSIFDSFYRANGMKIRNIVISEGNSRGLRYSNISGESMENVKYVGAFVIHPKKQFITSKLSIEECINKSELGYSKFKQWSTLSDDTIMVLKSLIDKYGCEFTKMNDEDKQNLMLQNLPECFIDFLKYETPRPITGLDFASLYPSIIMSYNISPEYIIKDRGFAKHVYKTFNYPLRKVEFKYAGTDHTAWIIQHENIFDSADKNYKFGVLPTILKKLFDARTQLKKNPKGLSYWSERRELLKKEGKENTEEFEEVEYEYNKINVKQIALKVFMNTFYGEAGNRMSPLFVLEAVSAITSLGQYNLKLAYDYVKQLNCKVYYGDSVVGDTPILLKNGITGKLKLTHFNLLGELDKWISYEQFKSDDNTLVNKQQLLIKDILIWTSDGWAFIKRVIRHKCTKKLYMVNTHYSSITVTEDHSMISYDGNLVRPGDLVKGKILLSNRLNLRYGKYLDVNLVKMYALFVLYGKVVGSQKIEFIVKASLHTYIVDVLYANNIITKITLWNDSIVIHSNELAKIYKCIFYIDDKNIQIPDVIINSSKASQKLFIDEVLIEGNVYSKNILLIQGFIILLNNIGYHYTLDYIDSIYYLNKTNVSNDEEVVSIVECGYTNDYVYDIETETGDFMAGVGNLIVKNTDSLYISMPDEYFTKLDVEYYTGRINKLTYWTDMVTITMKVIEVIKTKVNNTLKENSGGDFLKMSYEEVLFPVIFTAKKKYAGIAHENFVNFSEDFQVFIKGLDIIKRGIPQVLVDMYMRILKRSMSINNILTVKQIVLDEIDTYYKNKWGTNDLELFTMTAEYKPHKKNVPIHTLRNKTYEEYGIMIEPNKRFKYIVSQRSLIYYNFRGLKKKLQVGDMCVLYDVAVKDENFQINLDYYMINKCIKQLARFIIYHKKFHVVLGNEKDEDIKSADLAKKYLSQYCERYSIKYDIDPSLYKNAYKISSSQLGQYSIMASLLVSGTDDNMNVIDFKEWILKLSIKHIKTDYGNYAKDYISGCETMSKYNNIKYLKRYGNKFQNNSVYNSRINMQCVYLNNYYNLVKKATTQYKSEMKTLESSAELFYTKFRMIHKIYTDYIYMMNNLIISGSGEKISFNEYIDTYLSDDMIINMKKHENEFGNLFDRYKCIYLKYFRILSVSEKLMKIKNKKLNVSVVNIDHGINNMVSAISSSVKSLSI